MKSVGCLLLTVLFGLSSVGCGSDDSSGSGATSSNGTAPTRTSNAGDTTGTSDATSSNAGDTVGTSDVRDDAGLSNSNGDVETSHGHDDTGHLDDRDTGSLGDGGMDSSGGMDTTPPPPQEIVCAEGFTCAQDPQSDVVWVMKDDGNVNGPTCKSVCEAALGQSCTYHACDGGRNVDYPDQESFAPVAQQLGFDCREGGCWNSEAPSEGLLLVSINTDDRGTKACYFPTEAQHNCSTHPGNANCFGERYAAVCPCVPRALDQACAWECGPHHTTRATWKTDGTSCVERINYWRMRACEEGWVECPPAGLPPMVECTACHACANSQAEYDADNGAHASFRRCGERVQGVGGGATCADVIDGFVSERAPDENGVMRCQGHCGPILAPGCQTFFWGKARSSGLHVLNWRSCNTDTCQSHCNDNPNDCFTHDTSPSMACDDPNEGAEPGPVIACP